jgi:hypothetical protein
MRTIIPLSSDGLNNGGPIPRSYIEWHPLPIGYGSGADVSANGPSSSLFLHGGVRPYDAARFSDADEDLDDEWIFDISQLKWQPFGSIECMENKTIRSDMKRLYQHPQLTMLAKAYGVTPSLYADSTG